VWSNVSITLKRSPGRAVKRSARGYTMEGNELSVEQQRAKLALCVDLAHEVWGTL